MTDPGTLQAGLAISRMVAQLWLHERSGNRDLRRIFGRRIPEVFKQRQVVREFERIGEIAAERLAPLRIIEFSTMDAADAAAAERELTLTLKAADVSPSDVLSRDLDPRRLADSLRKTREFVGSAAAAMYFNRLVDEAAVLIILIAASLPDFESRATHELLTRETELSQLIRELLDRMPARGTQSLVTPIDTFEYEYRRANVNAYDTLELLGVPLPELTRRYSLSAAYVTLVAGRRKESHRYGRAQSTYVRAPDLLSTGKRHLIRGEAGSGKTTLLQWLAVSSSRKDFKPPLQEWNALMPFLVQLRRCVSPDGKAIDLPRPEDFPDQVASPLSGAMPQGWVHSLLRKGNALLLVDGVDEVPRELHLTVRKWLGGIVAAFPLAHFVVTSRPTAIGDSWLSDDDFLESELQPMNLADIERFIDSWHHACSLVVGDDEELRLLRQYKQSLITLMRSDLTLRDLASTPLLCALVCTLNVARKAKLPNDRMELYDLALEMLLQQRDLDRNVPAHLPLLSKGDKVVLLQGLAWWLVLNEKAVMPESVALAELSNTLELMPHIAAAASPVLNLLLQRAGILRRPAAGEIDFIHRSIQEFLGSAYAVRHNHIPALISRAGPDWRDVFIFAVGHASPRQRDEMLLGVVERAGDADAPTRTSLSLLTVAALATARELSPATRERALAPLAKLVPPFDMTDAASLAAGGSAVVPYLEQFGHEVSVTVAQACVRTLCLIGGIEALDALRNYASDSRRQVADELLRGWERFDSTVYAQEILSRIELEDGELTIDQAAHIQPLVLLPSLRRLTCRFVVSSFESEYDDQPPDLSPLGDLSQLEALDITGWRGNDFSWLNHLFRLKELTMANTRIADLAPLARLYQLRSLNLEDCQMVRDLRPLASLRELRHLSVAGAVQVADISPLRNMTALESLSLASLKEVTDLAPISKMWALRRLDVSGLSKIASLSDLAILPLLTYVSVRGTLINEEDLLFAEDPDD